MNCELDDSMIDGCTGSGMGDDSLCEEERSSVEEGGSNGMGNGGSSSMGEGGSSSMGEGGSSGMEEGGSSSVMDGGGSEAEHEGDINVRDEGGRSEDIDGGAGSSGVGSQDAGNGSGRYRSSGARRRGIQFVKNLFDVF